MKRLIPIAVASVLFLTACSSGNYAATEIPAKPEAPATSAAPPPASNGCARNENPLASYAPDGPLPAAMQMPAGSYMAKIQQRGRLIAGVSADSLHLGARDPLSGQIVGFDIDMVKAVATAIFGDWKGHLELRVISSPARIPSLRDTKNPVDIVARNMTINCDRWKQIAFSAEYYRSGQKTLIQRDAEYTSLTQMSGRTVCAPAGSTSLDNLKKKNPAIKTVTADSDTGCLVLFQQGKADGISGDDTVLAGDAAQDPYAKVIAERISDEPYGLGINLNNVDFVKFVNGVLAEIKANGKWQESYTKWLGTDLGKAVPPAPVYGRTP